MYLFFYILSVSISIAWLIILYKSSIPLYKFMALGIVIALGSFYFSRLFAIIETNVAFDFAEMFDSKYGLTFYGGFFFSFVTVLIFGFTHFNTKALFNQFIFNSVLIFLIGYAIGRLGCHFSADGCYGKVTFNGWGIRYTWGEYQTLFPVYPTPLFETICSVLLSLLLYIAYRLHLKVKLLICIFFVFFPLGRFLLEFIRSNPIYMFNMTFNQLTSLIITPTFILIYLTLNKIKSYEKISLSTFN